MTENRLTMNCLRENSRKTTRREVKTIKGVELPERDNTDKLGLFPGRFQNLLENLSWTDGERIMGSPENHS